MILVTGGTGFVGSHLLYKLASNSEKVKAIYRTENKINHVKHVFSTYTNNYNKLFNSIDWIQADILDIPALTSAFKDITHVYHCAAFVSFNPNDYQVLRKINIEGTANVVNLCIANYIKKMCYVSSVATLGPSLNNKPITESNDWNPETDNSVYAITKYGAEMEVWRGTQEGLDAVIVNPSVIIGKGMPKSEHSSFLEKIKKGVNFYTSGTIALVSVEDVVTIMIALLNSQIKNSRFILVAEIWTYKRALQDLSRSFGAKYPEKKASKRLLQIAWRLDWLKTKITGKKRLLTRQIVNSLTSDIAYSNDKIKEALNYRFKTIDLNI